MDALVLLVPFLPFLACLIIGIGCALSVLTGEDSEYISADIGVGALGLSFLMASALWVADILGQTHGYFSVGQWLSCDTLDVRINFISTGFNVHLAVVLAFLLWVCGGFAVNNLHQHPGFHRFFFLICLTAAAMQILVLSANMVGTFAGWVISGWCGYFLMGFAYEKPLEVANANRVMITQQMGDLGFLLAIGLCYNWLDNINWARLTSPSAELGIGQATGISLCLAWSAFAKSAQLPFTPWLVRAVKVPVVVSAVIGGVVMVHAGIYLVWLLRSVFEQSPFAMAVLGVVGVMTALYSFTVGLVQTDTKNVLAFAVSAQLGLMFFECALGWWTLVAWHVCAHAIVRSLQLLSMPRFKPSTHPHSNSSFRVKLAQKPWAYTCALQHFWFDPIIDWALVNPLKQMSQDLSYFDSEIIDRLIGAPEPANNTLSTLAEWEAVSAAKFTYESEEFAKANGLIGKLAQGGASFLQIIEERLVFRGLGKDAKHKVRKLGYAANLIERVLFRPRYLVLFMCITFLVAF